MRLWSCAGSAVGAIMLFSANLAGARPTAAFPSESRSAESAAADDASAAAPGRGVHAVAPQRQPQQLGDPESRPARPAILPPPELSPSEARRWYGGYTLMADGISLASAVVGGLAEPTGEPLLWIAGGGYLLGAPIVHLAHGNPGRAVASLGLRVGLPVAFVGVGAVLEDCQGQDFCGFASVLIGVPLGMATAIALDAAVLSRDTVERPFAIVPTATLGTRSATVGLSGAF